MRRPRMLGLERFLRSARKVSTSLCVGDALSLRFVILDMNYSSCSLRGPRDPRDLRLEYARDVSDKYIEVIVDLPPVPAVPRDFACENNKGHGEAPAGPSSPATLASIADRLRRVHEHHVPGSANIYDHRTTARRAR